MAPGAVSDVRVDRSGVSAVATRDAVLDVRFDGRRIFSFHLLRDARPEGPRLVMSWPAALRRFLTGTTQVTVLEHGAHQPLAVDDVRFDDAPGRVAVVDRQGRPLALDKLFKASLTFEGRSAEVVQPLLDAIEEVLAALGAAGLDAFLAYGTLLGAVRDGRLIGHDSDADLGYVSRHTGPADVVAESFRVQRALGEAGYRTTRYSGAAFKVDVVEGDGSVRGLDVFGGFVRDGKLAFLGELWVDFGIDRVLPTARATLEGRELPVPADAEGFLEITYGPAWRVPDPAFQFEPPRATRRRLSGWFRGIRVGRAEWAKRFAQGYAADAGPSDLVRDLARDLARAPARDPARDLAPDTTMRTPDTPVADAPRRPADVSVIDIGCGRGHDAALLAELGYRVLALDLVAGAYRAQARRWADEERVEFWQCNLLELRHTAVAATAAGLLPGRRIAVARHVLDALAPHGRANLWRLARTALHAPGDELHLEFLVEDGHDGQAQRLAVTPLAVERVLAELEESGGRALSVDIRALGPEPGSSRVCRMRASWA